MTWNRRRQQKENAASGKDRKHRPNCEGVGKGFIPFAIDVCGILDGQAAKLLSRFSRGYATAYGQTNSWARAICHQRVSFALQLAIARQLIAVKRPGIKCAGDALFP